MSDNTIDNQTQIALIGLYSILYIISLVSGYFYLSYYINKLIVSKSLFIFCVFYFSLFIYLQFISNLDFLFHTLPAIKFKDQILIKYFYDVLNTIIIILKFIIFPIYIRYSKSGYFTKKKKIISIFCCNFNKKKKYIILLLILIVLITCIIIFKNFYEQIIDYYGRYKFIINYVNFWQLIQIYLNIGFFFVYLIIDCKKKLNKQFEILFYNFIREKVNKKAEKDIKKLNNAYQILYKQIILSNIKNTKIEYYNYISLLINETKDNNDIYKINYLDKDKDNEINEVNNNNIKNSENSKKEKLINENSYNLLPNENENNINNEENIINNNYNNNNEKYDIRIEEFERVLIKKDFDQIEKELAEYVSKFKKELRKIKRLKDIIEFLDEDENLDKNCLSKAWNCFKYFMYFYSFFLIIIIEYTLLKKSTQRADEYERQKRKLEEKSDNFFEFIMTIVIIILFSIINSPYTIAVAYSIYKRKIISGDLIFRKHCADNLNLIETIKTIAGFALPLAYCNIYLYYILMDKETLEKPFLYESVKFPLYYIREKIESQILIKFCLTFISAILSIFFGKICFYKINDFGSVRKLFTANNY